MLNWGYAIHPGIYALMGAAGGLAGFSRMTMSLAVICLEITNNMYLLLPLMLVIMSSKVLAVCSVLKTTAGFLYRAGAQTTPNFREHFRVSLRTILSAMDTQIAVLVSTAKVCISAPDT